MHNLTLLILRIFLAADVTLVTWIQSNAFQLTAIRFETYGYPVPSLILGLALFTGIVGSVLSLVGLHTRAVACLLLTLFVVPMSVFFSLYTGNAWGEYQWLLQLVRLLEPAFMVISLMILALNGPGDWSLTRFFEERRLSEAYETANLDIRHREDASSTAGLSSDRSVAEPVPVRAISTMEDVAA